ncbi:MAG: molybdate ABC transporter permease subunit [Hydrococcus sp. CRU_1_1]|nr:molybdate ABC transporter permease subunit [Hydrococcus sp. CRU_1_1]
MPFDLSPLWISLKTSALATVFTFFLGIGAAYWMLGYRGRWKSLIEGIFVSPLILPPTVVGFLLLLLFGKNGPIGKLLSLFEISIVFTWYAAVLTATVVSFPLMYKTALGAFEQIDAALVQVARTLGASEGKIFWRIILPLSIPGILAGLTLSFARALGEFGATLMLAGNIPGQTQTIPMAIYFAVEAGAMNEAWIWVLIIMSISLSGIVATNVWQQKRSHLGETGRRGDGEMGRWGDGEMAEPSFSISSNTSLLVDIQKQLSGFSLEASFNTGQVPLGLLGASGAGKSMILRCIAGVETPTHGRIVLNGRVLFDAKEGINVPSRDRHIGYLVQNYALFPHLTVAQNIAFALPKGLDAATVKQRVAQQLELVQLPGLENRYPHQLSGGQQQRVALARALVTRPEALLLDEPFSALDTHLRTQLEREMSLTLSRYEGVSLFVTHNLEEAYRICENLLVMEKGQVVACGSKQEIFERPATYSVAQLTGCKNFSRAIAIGYQEIEASDWGVRLQVIESIPHNLAYVGVRAHQLIFTDNGDCENTFPCWLASTSETPHRMTLYLKLNSSPAYERDYHLQAEVFKEKWIHLKDRPFPWYVQFNPFRLMLMK